MQSTQKFSALILGVFICLGLSILGYLLGKAAIDFKQFDRSVTVKGLSEQEFDADIILWPIKFMVTGNDLGLLYDVIDENTKKIKQFLVKNNIDSQEISFSSPTINDKTAQQYGGGPQPKFRYIADKTVTVYSGNVAGVRAIMGGEFAK